MNENHTNKFFKDNASFRDPHGYVIHSDDKIYRIIKSAIIVKGKPNEKKFSAGADRVTTPIVTLTSSSIETTGNIISAPR